MPAVLPQLFDPPPPPAAPEPVPARAEARPAVLGQTIERVAPRSSRPQELAMALPAGAGATRQSAAVSGSLPGVVDGPGQELPGELAVPMLPERLRPITAANARDSLMTFGATVLAGYGLVRVRDRRRAGWY